jgi:DNA repair protein RadA/Sms
VSLREVSTERSERLATGIAELDRVLGGGLVPGSLVLLGGSPGIGKSTLAGMALANLAAGGRKTLYASGEESASQIRRRAERLGEGALEVPVLAEHSLDAVLATIEAERPVACVIDSVQTLAAGEGAPGSVAAVREATGALLEAAKRLEVTMVLIGHVTKEGSLAGPRALEHLVDCVLHFEGERERAYRTVRALKNRFGATSEVGVFEMRQGGLVEVADPSARFVGEARRDAAGSVVLCAMEGTRPLLVEVQALVAPTEVEHPRRTATGIDRNRLALVIAVLTRHAKLKLGAADVFVNIAGGVRVEEPGADLAIALAIASAQAGRPLEAGDGPLACFGELGLTGELRFVAHADRRVAEARKFGLGPVIGPRSADEEVKGLSPADTLAEALRAAGARGSLRAAA